MSDFYTQYNQQFAYSPVQSYALQQQHKFATLRQYLQDGLLEREKVVAVALLSALAGHNTFFLGSPGTAKSFIARRISSAFTDTRYYEVLLTRFTTPDEIFGPVSLGALKQDIYQRKHDNYLPSANFAFLDEIWKSSSAVLNTMLTIINEGIFRNGDQVVQTNLRSLIAASNEVPDTDSELAAMYDRFSVRIPVMPIQEETNFRSLLSGSTSSPHLSLDPSQQYSQVQIEEFRHYMQQVQLSEQTQTNLWNLKQKLSKENIYVSDRRWRKIAELLRASALINGRVVTNEADEVIMQYCLWDKLEDFDKIKTLLAADEADYSELRKKIKRFRTECINFGKEFNSVDQETIHFKTRLDKYTESEVGSWYYDDYKRGLETYFSNAETHRKQAMGTANDLVKDISSLEWVIVNNAQLSLSSGNYEQILDLMREVQSASDAFLNRKFTSKVDFVSKNIDEVRAAVQLLRKVCLQVRTEINKDLGVVLE